MNDCETCANYQMEGCMRNREYLIQVYNYDCWISEEEKWMCDMMCGDIEKEY